MLLPLPFVPGAASKEDDRILISVDFYSFVSDSTSSDRTIKTTRKCRSLSRKMGECSHLSFLNTVKSVEKKESDFLIV